MLNRYDQADVARILDTLVASIAARFPPNEPLNVVGIRTRGENLADRIYAALLQRGYTRLGRGVLDVTLYRDDLSSGAAGSRIRPTDLVIPIDDAPLLLVDDVLYTGRSVRSALIALNDFGRPGVIRLAVLVEREGRELPIAADFIGISLHQVPPNHRVYVRLAEVDGVDEIVVEPLAGKGG